jgi:hypothetical protein
MYGLAYVLIPQTFASLQAELDRTLAPFMRGGDDKFPRDKLAFDDATDRLARLHRTAFRYGADGSITWREADAASSFDLRLGRLAEHVAADQATRMPISRRSVGATSCFSSSKLSMYARRQLCHIYDGPIG